MRTIGSLLICSLLVAPAALAKDKPQGQSKHSRYIETKRAKAENDRRAESYSISPRDVQVIREYYAPRYRALPPGLQKKLYRTGQLPPGWQKKMQPLPVVVERRLAPVPRVYRRGFFDNYVVVVDPRTNRIVDVTPVAVRR